MKSTAFLAAAACLAAGCIPKPQSGAGSDVRIVGGTAVNQGDPLMTFTAAILKNGHLNCSAVLLYPDVLATAAHCLTDADMVSGSPQVVFGPRSRATDPNAHVFTVKGWYAHPSYDPDLVVYDRAVDDVGLIYLDAPVPSEVGTPVPIVTDALQAVPNQTVITLAGYGTTGTKNLDAGILRSATTTEIDSDGQAKEIYTLSTIPVHNACYGDSGGPAAIQDDGGKWYAIGTAAAYLATSTKQCESGSAAYSDLHRHKDWVTRHRTWTKNQSARAPSATATATGTATGAVVSANADSDQDNNPDPGAAASGGGTAASSGEAGGGVDPGSAVGSTSASGPS